MRHLWSLLAGVVAAPLVWLFLSTGQYRSQRAVVDWDAAGRFDTAHLVGPVIFLVVAGILLGVIGTMRWSPAGPLAAGILFIVPTVLMFANPFTTLDRFARPDDGAPRRVLGQSLQPWLPVENGTLLVLGVLLLMAMFSIQRWRRWPALAAPLPPATDEEVVSGISALGRQTPPAEPPAQAPAETETEQRTPVTLTDDEILAAAAAFETSEATRPVTPATEELGEVKPEPGPGPDEETR